METVFFWETLVCTYKPIRRIAALRPKIPILTKMKAFKNFDTFHSEEIRDLHKSSSVVKILKLSKLQVA
jgi:hypothetical protein